MEIGRSFGPTLGKMDHLRIQVMVKDADETQEPEIIRRMPSGTRSRTSMATTRPLNLKCIVLRLHRLYIQGSVAGHNAGEFATGNPLAG